MAEIQNFGEEEEEVDIEPYREERVFDKLTVYNFSSRPWTFDVPLDEKSHEFTSPVMRTYHEDKFDFAWRLSYIKAARDNYPNNVTLSLLRFDKRHLEVCVRCYLNDGYYTNMITEERSFDFDAEAPIQKEFTLWDSDLQRIYRERLVDLLRNQENHLSKLDSLPLSIRVDFEFLEMDYGVCSSFVLAEDLEKLLKHNDELADVTFEIGGKEIKAHKCILAARSPVFAKMFRSKEKHDGRYSIEDIEPDIFRLLLNFVYCGKTDNARSCNKLTELSLAAGKYGLTL